MTGKTHKAVGVCVGIAFTYWGIKTHGDPIFAISTIASAAGAMLPDIDHNNSKLGAQRKAVVNTAAKMTKVLSSLFAVITLSLCAVLAYSGLYTQMAVLLLLIILPVIMLSVLSQLTIVKKAFKFTAKHRGIMHTLAIPLLFFLGFNLISNEAVRFSLLAAAAGYVSHLLLDCLTKMGCPIMWPLYSKNISFLPIKTGSIGEYAVSYFIAAAVLVFAFFGTSVISGVFVFKKEAPDENAASKKIFASLEEIIALHDERAALYESALSAAETYLSAPSQENLDEAYFICENALELILSFEEVTPVQEDKLEDEPDGFYNSTENSTYGEISELSLLNIDAADYYALFEAQSEYKEAYLADINELLYYLRYAPLFDSEFNYIVEMRRSVADSAYKITYLTINKLFADTIGSEYMSDFMTVFLPGLKIFGNPANQLPWGKDKNSLVLQIDSLRADIKEAENNCADILAVDYGRWLQSPEGYKYFLFINGLTTEESDERIERMSKFLDSREDDLRTDGEER